VFCPSERRLGSDEIDRALSSLTGWSRVDGKLHREYRFADFAAALAFMVRVGVEADKRNHHPEWSNVYNRVTVDLVTHDAGGITERDIKLASRMDEIALRAAS